MKKIKRSEKLIANFKNGYADGWFFAVGEFFKDQLDIKYTKRIINKKQTMMWTQGPFFNFSEGHIFYDTPKGYLIWDKALTLINLSCSVISGTPNVLDDEDNFIEGQVYFQLSKTNQEKTKMEPLNSYHTNQNDFVSFLKTGELKNWSK